MASSDYPGNLATNTYILHDYLEIAYIVCTGAIPANVENSANAQSVNSKERVLARLRNARQQFRQAAILVVLDAEKLELITFYKKADIVKDQQAILAKFGHICKLNACKIERKNACRVVDLVKPELARVWKLFSEAVLSSLTIQTPSRRKVLTIDTNVHLVPDSESAYRGDPSQGRGETRYHLRRADLQIIAGGHLLLAMRETPWPPLYLLADLVDTELSSWKIEDNTTVYLLPSGQLARYVGGWIGPQSTSHVPAQPSLQHVFAEMKSRSRWFVKVREWLHNRNGRSQPLTDDSFWCTVEIPVLGNIEDKNGVQKAVVWKTVVWPATLTYVFKKENTATFRINNSEVSQDPLTGAQTWFTSDLADVRAMAADRELLKSQHDIPLNDGHLFDEDVHFGSPQQFMSAQAQTFNPSQMVYPTPPEVGHLQNTPGTLTEVAAQTPVSAQPMQPSMYQSSPLAIMTDSETLPGHESAISSFLQNNDDDLFDDDEDEDEDQKLAQRSFGDEPNWDFFDRETNVLDMKADMNFEEPERSPNVTRSPKTSHDDHSQAPHTEIGTDRIANDEMKDKAKTVSSLSPLSKPTPAVTTKSVEEPPQQHPADIEPQLKDWQEDAINTAPSKIRDFAPFAHDVSLTSSGLSNSKRRRSSAYDVHHQQHTNHDHKYGPSGKYHFQLKRPVVPTNNGSERPLLVRQTSSASSSPPPSESDDDSEHEDKSDSRLKSWTHYEPIPADDVQTPLGEKHADYTFLDAEVEELIGIISTASGTEPFTAPRLSKQIHEREPGTRETTDRLSMVAQILTEQLTQSSVLRDLEVLQLPRTAISPAFDIYVDSIESGANVPNATLGDLASIQSPNSNAKPATRPIALDVDRVRLKQADSIITAEPQIMKYWEALNLQPFSGPKDVQAICIHPVGSNYLQGSNSFLRRLEETYTSCNLGIHPRLRLEGLTDNGLLAWDSTPGNGALSTLCQSIGKALASENARSCTVIYVILPGDEVTRCVEICDAFVELFETFGQVNHTPEGDVVLQIVPSSFLLDSDNIVVKPQQHYVDLALEVYNRVPSLESSQQAATAAAVTLEKPVGRPLHFELNSKVSCPSLRSGHCYHIAYCSSADRKWLVASWSDTVGHIALTMSYCLVGEDNESRRARLDVLKHICETSVHLMSRQKGQSWLAVAKVGIYDPDELQEWLYLSQQLSDEHKFISRIVIVNVEMQSRLMLHGPHVASKQYAAGPYSAANALSTPVSTPQASTTSPEQNISTAPMAASAQTPPDLNADPAGETDTYLNDPLNEAWMVMLAFGLNQTHNFLEVRPAQASGFLLKRATRQDSVGCLAMLNVNLIAVPRKGGAAITPADREQVLQDILMQYRGLHLLAVARRCVDDGESCVPWHVATAFKGAKTLERLM